VIDPDDPPRTWTPVEADAVLAEVRRHVTRAKAAVVALGGRARTATGAAPTNGHARGGGEAEVVRAAIDALEAMGILLRDPGRGLVDFPARAATGRPYWLCWLDGEPSVAWWHWVEDGFAGRAPITDLP
jgi:hypothetical protein